MTATTREHYARLCRQLWPDCVPADSPNDHCETEALRSLTMLVNVLAMDYVRTSTGYVYRPDPPGLDGLADMNDMIHNLCINSGVEPYIIDDNYVFTLNAIRRMTEVAQYGLTAVTNCLINAPVVKEEIDAND